MSLPVSVIVDASQAAPEQVARALESALSQEERPARIVVAGDLAREGLRHALVPFEGDARLLDTGPAPPAELRSRALAEVDSDLVTLVDGHETLAAEALARHVASLGADTRKVASYGRTAVHSPQRVRVLPEEGRGGDIVRRLVKDKHLVAAAASLVWRRDALGPAPFGPYRTPWAQRLDLALALARRGPFVFHPAVLAQRPVERLDIAAQEELVKVLVGVLYAPEPLDERLEARTRFRLARHLVAIGKLHYRGEDYLRAGKFFEEAVRAAPGYFKGRRYQFLNFVQKTLTR